MANDPNISKGNIIMSRIRLARNVSGLPFKVKDERIAREIIKSVNRALIKRDTFNLYSVSSMSDIKLEAMKERHLISQNLIDNKEFGAVLINVKQDLSVMLNEEDHIREQCFKRGLDLESAYKELTAVDDDIAKNLDIAYSKQYGYITACPTNLGTGMRASVMMFLPALTQSGKINYLFDEVSKLGLTVRGLYGEGSNADGCIYQISNEVTLGVEEHQIIKAVSDTVNSICDAERDEIEKILAKNELGVMDSAKKSFGVLTNAVMLSYSEFLTHISNVKLGAMLGMINVSNVYDIDDLIITARPANICEHYGKRLSSINRDLYRAELVGAKLLKIKE